MEKTLTITPPRATILAILEQGKRNNEESHGGRK
jgi:hypothetical protein